MVQAISHRGPDARGQSVQGACGLGHARLSIIDVPAAGTSRWPTKTDRVWITFNGEIFNYVELRAELEPRGHRFATQSDTEVILHLYEEKGDDCVRRPERSVGVCDLGRRRRRLFLSRDRLGVRPALLHGRRRSDFLFASEIKALCAHPGRRAASSI